MEKWEYKSIVVSGLTVNKMNDRLEEKANELGEEGYELVCFDGVEAATIVAVFKRKVAE